LWSTTSPQYPQSEMNKVRDAKSNAFEQLDFAIHTFNETTGDTVGKEVDNF